MEQPKQKRKWAAQDLADDIHTLAQANTRLKTLKSMIETQEKKKWHAQMMINKHQKEIQLLEQRWIKAE
jgi:hypothetical protein